MRRTITRTMRIAIAALLALAISTSALAASGTTGYVPEVDTLSATASVNYDLQSKASATRPTVSIYMTVAPHSRVQLLSLPTNFDAGQVIRFRISYTPINANIALVVRCPDGSREYVYGIGGMINYMFVATFVGQTGPYRFYIENNSDVPVMLQCQVQW